jgi:hypothetical protein
MPVMGSTALAGRGGLQELLCGERFPGSTHSSSGTWGTARAALRGAIPGEHCSSGTWGAARAAQRGARVREQSFSSVGENAQWGAVV